MVKLKISNINREDAQDGETIETFWDVKKIVVGFIILALFFIAAAYVFLPRPSDQPSIGKNETLGVSSADGDIPEKGVPPFPTKENIEDVISSARETLSQITSDNLTSSQAAIQKMITELQSLQGKNDAVGLFCELVCKK